MKIKFEAWLRPANFREQYNFQIDKRLTGTCDWVFGHDAFLQWINSPSSEVSSDRLLCISGQPGCGKSVIAASICDHLKSQGHFVFYFPFSGTVAHQRNLDDLARCLLWQAALHVWDDAVTNEISNRITSGQPLTRELWDLLSYCLAKYQHSPTYFVIDGLDECQDSSSDLYKQIIQITSNHKELRAVILGRSDSMTSWPDTIHRLKIDSFLNQHDIEAFILSQFDTLEVVQSAELRELALRTLRDKSDGMFLWVQLMIDALRKCTSRMEVKERLNNLPHDLQGAYRHILQQMVSDLDDIQLKLASRILSFVVAARHPMTMPELQYALALEAQLSSLDAGNASLQDYMMVNPFQQIPNLCRGFLEVSMAGIKVVHFSVVEFLLTTPDAVREEPKALQQFFLTNISEVHRSLAQASLHYLREDDYDCQFQDSSELARALSEHPFLAYSSDNLAYHYNHVADLTRSDFSQLESFLMSQSSGFWFQKLGYSTMENLDFHMNELSKLTHTIQRSYDNQQQFFESIALHLLAELTRRRSEFGDNDLRTTSWGSALFGLGNCIGHLPFNDQVEQTIDSLENLSAEDTLDLPSSDPLHFPAENASGTDAIASQSLRQPATAPSTAMLNGMHRELLALAEAGEPFALSVVPNAVKKALAISERWKMLNIVIDPLVLLFRAILRAASKIPARILIVVSKFYQGIGKLTWSLELCQIALMKAEDPETLLRYQVLYEIGRIQSRLACRVEALAAYQSAYQGFERLLSFSDSLTAKCFMRVVGHLSALGRTAQLESLPRSAPHGWEEHCWTASTVWFFFTMDSFISLYVDLNQLETAHCLCLKVCEKAQKLLNITNVCPRATRARLFALRLLGHYEEATRMHPALMDRQDTRFQSFTPEDWCLIYSELADNFTGLHELEEAEKMWSLAAELSQMVDQHRPTRGFILVGWMEALYDLGRFYDVQQLGRRFLDEGYDVILRTACYSYPIFSVRGLITLAHAFHKTRDYSHASETFQRCVAEIAAMGYNWRKQYENAHMMLVICLLNQNRHTEAQQVLQGFDFSRFEFERSWRKLVDAISELEEVDTRAVLLNVLASKLESTFGVTRQTLRCQMNEAKALAIQGRFPEASLILRKVFPKAAETLEPTDNLLIELCQWQAYVLGKEGKAIEAQKVLSMTFRITDNMSSLPRLDLDIVEWCTRANDVLNGLRNGPKSTEHDRSEHESELSVSTCA